MREKNNTNLERMRKLIERLTEADIAYYKNDAPIMTDLEYDRLTEELASLEHDRLRYYAAHGNELCWRYPISDGIHAGAFILATKDGYLSLPYNSMDEEDYEILVLDDAVFHDLASLTTFLSDWEDFSADLTDALREMCRILEGGEEDA